MAAIAHDFVPSTEEDLAACLADPMWRLCSGRLYKIITKGDDGKTDLVVPFKPNRAQRRFIRALWHRNVILKARQLGFTTLVCLMWLDFALFNSNVRCGIIAHDLDSAGTIFRDKVKFAYDNLPDQIRQACPLAKDSASELLFAHNNSSIRVATSMRSGTIHRLLISELGKIAAKHRDKAAEVMTGSIPTVPKNGILIVESTAEGREGEFYDMVQVAKQHADSGKTLTERDYRMHFFPWWEEPGYVMDPAGVVLGAKDLEYFVKVEAAIGKEITPEQRAWYVATRNSDFRSNPERMWQEYPSTIDEAFQVSTEGCYYTQQLSLARQQGRIGKVPHDPAYPVNTFWDIGKRDKTAIWFHQRINGQDRFIDYYESAEQTYSHFAEVLQGKHYVYNTHYLPHDAGHERQGEKVNKTPEQMLNDLGITNTFVLDRVDDKVRHGIYPTRDAFGTCLFDEEHCKDGIVHLELYRKEWDDRLGVWRETPRHDDHSNGADAFRQFGQAKHLLGTMRSLNDPKKRRSETRRGRVTNWRVA